MIISKISSTIIWPCDKGKGGEKKLGKKMTINAASRIQSVSAKKSGGKVSKGSFAARASKAAARNKK